MLPDFLIGSYRQYKQDEKYLTKWLCATARSYGYISEALPKNVDIPEQATKTKKKAKYKTKKQQRDAARRIPKEQRVFTIAIAEFVPLAQYITDHIEPPSKVPSTIFTVITRSIEARRSTNSWFESDSTEAEEVEGGHAYFISVLQKVHDLLQPYAKMVEKIDEEDETTLVEDGFDILSLEEPSEEFLKSTGVKSTTADEAQASRMAYEVMGFFKGKLEQKLEESLAASALFRDIHKILDHAKRVWHQYSKRGIDIVAASLTSNLALDIIRRLEEDFFEQFPKFRKVDQAYRDAFKKKLREENIQYQEICHRKGKAGPNDAQQLINWMFRAKCNAAGIAYWSTKDDDDEESLQAQFNMDAYDTAKHLFMDMQSIFAKFIQFSGGMERVVYSPVTGPGRWDVTAVPSSMTNEENYQQDAKILLEMIPDLVWLSTSKTRKLAEDELMKGCREAAGGEIHIWTLAAARLYCDIHYMLGADIEKSFEALQQLGGDVKTTVAQGIANREQGISRLWSPENDDYLKENLIDLIEAWLFEDEWRKDAREMAAGEPFIDEDHHLLRRHPWLCGLIRFTILARLQEFGTSSLDNAGVSVAHLYNLMQRDKDCAFVWSDMEFVVDTLSCEQLFVGGKPNTFEEAFKRLSIHKGFSVTQFAANRRSPGYVRSKKGRRHLHPAGELIHVLRSRHYYEFDRETDKKATLQTLENVEQVLDTKYQLIHQDNRVTIEVRDVQQVQERTNKASYQKAKHSPLDLLMMFQFGISREIAHFEFDYLAFCGTCWDILRDLYIAMQPIHNCESNVLAETELQSNMAQWPHMVDVLFMLSLPVQTIASLVPRSQFDSMVRGVHDKPSNPCQAVNPRPFLCRLRKMLDKKLQDGQLGSNKRATIRQKLEVKNITYELSSEDDKASKVTFKKDKATLHRSTLCTKEYCMCGRDARTMQAWATKPEMMKPVVVEMLTLIKKAKAENTAR
ncbi:hypothetical protein LTR64_002215 [Lithohypha guttulata]|uniref:uncharacterized protein n=1 Tax=Lithohypha guttulata TaxID=1690604 RepID=UPI002DDDE9E4|nr:hypothetical protein LTR51_001559 [Lithohypha guttulata]